MSQEETPWKWLAAISEMRETVLAAIEILTLIHPWRRSTSADHPCQVGPVSFPPIQSLSHERLPLSPLHKRGSGGAHRRIWNASLYLNVLQCAEP